MSFFSEKGVKTLTQNIYKPAQGLKDALLYNGSAVNMFFRPWQTHIQVILETGLQDNV